LTVGYKWYTVAGMKLKAFLQGLTADEKREFARRCGTTYLYLKQLSGGHARPGPALARMMVKHSEGALSLTDLRPDVWPARMLSW